MLVLTRKTDERIVIGETVDVVVLSIQGNRVRLGISAPRETPIVRGPSASAENVAVSPRRRHAVQLCECCSD